MSEVTTWGLYGQGTIGREVLRQLAQPTVAARMGLSPTPAFVLRSTGIYTPDSDGNLTITGEDLRAPASGDPPRLVFNALPAGASHRSYRLMKAALTGGQLVVTAEKGALATNFPEFA